MTKTQELIERIDEYSDNYHDWTDSPVSDAYSLLTDCKAQLTAQADEIKRLREAATGELPLHAGTGLKTFVTRLEADLKSARAGVTQVNAKDLKDLLYHFIRLDNEARNLTPTIIDLQAEIKSLRKGLKFCVDVMSSVEDADLHSDNDWYVALETAKQLLNNEGV